MNSEPNNGESIIDLAQTVLVTGAAGFIGRRLVRMLQERGFSNIRCLLRPEGDASRILESGGPEMPPEIIRGDLLSREDCAAVTRDSTLIYHLAAATGTNSFADAYLNSVVTTRNLIEAALDHGALRRIVNVSSFAVYTNRNKPCPNLLDENCPVEANPETRGDAYCYAKVKQDELVMAYGRERGLPYVFVRPGVVYGPGKERIHGRVGLDTFGVFLHLGGSNPIPFTHVDNCADAIVLAGLCPGIEGQVFNVVDDDLPTSRQFLRLYKRRVRRFPSLYVPSFGSYLLSLLWEKYSAWSRGQLPPVHNRRNWASSWKRTQYSNAKLKRVLGWQPRISITEGMTQFLEGCRQKQRRA